MDWNTIARQLLTSQGLATRAPGSRPAATTGRAPTLPPELGALPPQLIAALLSTLASNSAEPEPGSDPNPHSDMSRQASMVFKFGERPVGTAGRGEFNIQDALGLNDDDYDLILRTVRQICVLCHFDMNLAITKQHPDKVTRARAKIRKAFPGLALFAECKVPYWPVSGLLLVVMKASSQASQRRERRRREERESAASARSTPDPTVPTVPAGPAPPDDDEDEGMVGDMTVASVNEMDEMNGSEGVDEDSSDDEVDDTPFLDPPAYNPEPIPTAPVVAPAATRKTRTTTPATTDNDHASSLAPVAEPTTIPASTPNNATLVPVDPPAPVPNAHGRRRRRTKTTPTPAATTPTSTIAVATAIAAPSTTNSSVQAQASSTTGLPSDLADTSHFAWLPASKRPPVPPTLGPTEQPAIPAAKAKNGGSAVPDATQSKSSSKSKAKTKKTPEPTADWEEMGLSGPESNTSMEPEPVTKPTRRGRGKGVANGAAPQVQQKPAPKKDTKAKAASGSATKASNVAPQAKTKKK